MEKDPQSCSPWGSSADCFGEFEFTSLAVSDAWPQPLTVLIALSYRHGHRDPRSTCSRVR